MIQHDDPLALAGTLVTYPDKDYAARAGRFAVALAGSGELTASDAEAFSRAIAAFSLTEQQEQFTHTFDLNPVCALEVGWHLFGEDYKRGAFLVQMRQALASQGISEGGELPDHLSSLLHLAGVLRGEDALRLMTDALQPAVAKMLEPLEKSENPFRLLMQAIQRLLAARAADRETVHA